VKALPDSGDLSRTFGGYMGAKGVKKADVFSGSSLSAFLVADIPWLDGVSRGPL
jgi:hypothetical protein